MDNSNLYTGGIYIATPRLTINYIFDSPIIIHKPILFSDYILDRYGDLLLLIFGCIGDTLIAGSFCYMLTNLQ